MAKFTGGAGNDVHVGSNGDDTLVGAGGNDHLTGLLGNDLLVGNSGADYLDGGEGNDVLYSDDEAEFLGYPYYSPNRFDTGTEVDTLLGGAGDDVISGGYGDFLDGGDGYGDTLYISFMGATSGVIADFRLNTLTVGGGIITGFEAVAWVQGSNFDDVIYARSGSGGLTNGPLHGMGGNDQLFAGY